MYQKIKNYYKPISFAYQTKNIFRMMPIFLILIIIFDIFSLKMVSYITILFFIICFLILFFLLIRKDFTDILKQKNIKEYFLRKREENGRNRYKYIITFLKKNKLYTKEKLELLIRKIECQNQKRDSWTITIVSVFFSLVINCFDENGNFITVKLSNSLFNILGMAIIGYFILNIPSMLKDVYYGIKGEYRLDQEIAEVLSEILLRM